MATLSLKLLFIFMIAKIAFSLKCYQSNRETGEINLIEDDALIYCTVFPSILESNRFTRSASDGLRAEELDKPFENFFEENDNIYQLRSVCLFEEYDWPKAWNPKFNRGKKVPEIEFSLRCICNTDLCNSPNSFSSHINSLA
uniref:Uncharacterized protein n=1 Tax=Acrobeloides nanus TaxID=290746 RepID=A0A914CIZ2_9BILA